MNANDTTTVAEFLEAQARHLWTKTGGKLTGLVTLSQSVHGKCYSLYIVAPSVNKHALRLRLLVWNDKSGVERYFLECGIRNSEQVADALLVLGITPNLRPFHVWMTAKQTVDEIGSWLGSGATRSIIDSLIVHVNESEQLK